MYNISPEFRTAMTQPFKELAAYIMVGTEKIDEDDLINIDLNFDAELFKSNMTKAEILVSGEREDLQDKTLNIFSGVKLESGEFEYINYGEFKVHEIEITKDTEETKLICYDRMIYTMQPYNSVDITYPINLYDYAVKVIEECNLELENTNITNGDIELERDLFGNINGITYRDILEQIAEASATICLINKNGKVEFKDITDTTETLNTDNMMTLKLEEKYGEINSIVLSREPQEDNVYKRDEEAEEFKEIKIANNQILDLNRSEYIVPLFNKLNGLNYFTGETTTEGLGWYQVGDKIKVEDEDGILKDMIVSSIRLMLDGGIAEEIKSTKLRETTTQYQYATIIEKKIKNAELKVDKQEMKIEAVVSDVDELESQISEVTQTAEGLTATVTENIIDLQEKIAKLGLTQDELELIFKLQNGNNLIRNSVMKNGTSFWYKELQDVFATSVKPENPYDGQYWFNEEDSEEYKRNQLYQWNKADNQWVESAKSKYDLMNTGVEGFTQFENQESRENSISNSIVLMDAGNNILEKTHLFGITEGISIPTDTEIISLSLKVKNQIRTGNIYVNFGFAPVEPGDMVAFDEEGYLLYGIKEDWHKITPDDNTSWSKVERHLKVPKTEDLKVGYKGTTAPEDTTLLWLDDGNKSYGKFPVAKYYNEETESWEICEDCPPILIDNRIYTYREFYGGYYKTIYTKDDFKANYLFVALTCYPSANYETGPELPETATDRDSYFGILGSADTSYDIIYRAKFRDGEFESWVPTYIPSLLPLNPELQAMIPSPPFPTNTIIPVSGQFYFTDLKAESGMLCTAWSPHIEETYTTSYKSDSSGQKIISGENTMLMSDEEILATKGTEEVFRISGDLTKFKYIEAFKAKLSGLNIQKAKIGNTDTIIMF